MPGDIEAEAMNSSGTRVTYTVTALDNVDGPLIPVCSPASGSTFALGPTTVSCTATDSSGNSASGSFTVTVRDTTPPVVTVPASMIVEATSPIGAILTFHVTSTDLVDPSPTVSCSPPSGSTFALGPTTVSCTATDSSGNSASGSFAVTVRDTTPPALTLPPNIFADATRPNGAILTFHVTAPALVAPSPP